MDSWPCRYRLLLRQFEPALVAPVEELFYRARTLSSCCGWEGGGKEFDEAAAGALALGADYRRSASRPARISAGGGTVSSVRQDWLLKHRLGALPVCIST